MADDADADVVLVNTCGFIEAAKQESIDELLGAGSGGAKVVAAGCLAERYGSGLAEALPEAQILSFDDYGDIADRLDAVVAGERWPAHAPADRRRLLPIAPAGRQASAGRASARARHGPAGPPAGRRPAVGPAGAAAQARRRRGGAAEDRLGLRPAVQLLRDPLVPRRVRVPPAAGPGRRGRLAGHAGRPRAVPGQRELDLLRQGPGRPAAARGRAPRAGRGAGHRAGAGELPAARRGAAGAGRGDDLDPGRGPVLRPVVPARQRAGAAGHAPLRRRRAVLRAARPDQAGVPGGRRPVQLHRGLPRRDRGRRGRAAATSWPRPGSTPSGSSATPTRTAPRPRRCPGTCPRTRSRAGSRISPTWPTS